VKKLRGVFGVLLNVLNVVRLVRIIFIAAQGAALSIKETEQKQLWDRLNSRE